MSVDLPQLMRMSQAELDDVFMKAPAGSIPDGQGEGTAIIGPGTYWAKLLARFARRWAWQGKVFDRKEGELVNRVSVFQMKAIKADVYKAPSWLDKKECIVLDYSKTSLVARKIRDEIREVSPGLYLGKVFWGRRRLCDFTVEFRGASHRA